MIRSLKRAVGVASVLLAVGACATATTPDGEKIGSVSSAFAPGFDGTIDITAPGTMVNSYAAVTATTKTTITVADITTLGAGFGQGSLIMVMQMQGATIDQTDTATYGNVTALGNAGLFEFVHVASVAGNVITLEGACGGLQNTYTVAGHVQVIRVPEPQTLNVHAGGSLTGLAWDGTKGGVVAVRVAGTTTIDGTIDASALGFRGGALDQMANLPGTSVFRSTAAADGAAKGEGIAGYVAEYTATGIYGRGAPANGGGGGDAHNAGGGGGANGGLLTSWTGQGTMSTEYTTAATSPWRLDDAFVANGNKLTTSSGGGRGGYTYSASDQDATKIAPGNAAWTGDDRREVGGWGGRPINGATAAGTPRYYLGGGGGAGDNNDGHGTAGAVGGGIVFLASTTVTGAGAVHADGAAAATTGGEGNDAPGGGGGGGSIILAATTVTNITATANGGAGGIQAINNGNEAEGPGGGGGGGFIALPTGSTITASVNGAKGGTTNSPALTEFPENGATNGGDGTKTTPLTATQLAALSCYSDNAPTVSASATATTPENTTLTFGGANTISVADIDARTNPVQITLTVTNGTLTLSGFNGLTFTTGDGVADTTTTFTGTVAAVDAALNGLKFAPDANYSGAATLTILVNDQGNTMAPPVVAKTATATVNITVTHVNQPPVANPDTANAVPGVSVIIPVLANDTDPDNDKLSVASVTTPSVGTATVNADGTITYLAPVGSTGTATFTYKATDGTLTSNAATVTITFGGKDSDGDGLPDDYETLIGTNPNDPDSDDDGVPDGQEINPGVDSDGDGLINALDPDSDNDGLYDGTEMGKDCSNPGTDVTKHHCIADADPSTTTDPLNKDTDGGGVTDGSEDWNLNGKVDGSETDPTAGHGADDTSAENKDTDGDGLSDNLEKFLHSNPNDTDTDDDGVPDGKEANPADDNDYDGLIDVLDADSDNDALFDGTEMGFSCSNPDTDPSKHACIADADGGTTKTSPLLKDTDRGGVTDGSEDSNLNGIVDNGETDPTLGHGADDGDPQNKDSDGDGLSDNLEKTLGSNPNDADSDDDGVPDGEEANPSQDVDGDGLNDVNDPDSDGDGIFDGTEMGLGCSNPATDTSKHQCIPDADPTTTTSPINPDTDFGGVSDGVEDANHNGKVDPGETDPNNPLDDKPCKTDSDCGTATSGQICSSTTGGACIAGCRGTGGNGCPTGQTCSSTTDVAGQCSTGSGDGGASSGDGGAAYSDGGSSGALDGGSSGSSGGALGANPEDQGSLEGGGINCASTPGQTGSGVVVGLGLALAALSLKRRRSAK